MTVRHRFISGLKWSAFGKALGQIVSWAITIVVMRLLLPSDYGLMAIATMVVTLLSHVNEFGLGSALVQAKEIDDERCGSIFGAMLLLGCTLSLLLAIFSPALASFFDEPRLSLILSVAGLGFLVSAVSTVPEAMLRREMEFKSLAIADLINVVCASLLTLLLALADFGVWSLILGNLFGSCLRTIALHLMSPRRVFPNLRLGQCREFLGFGGYLTASRFAWWIMSQADVVIGAKLLSKEALGLYSVSVNLASLPMHKAMSVINQVMFSAVAKIQNEKESARNGLLEGLRWLGYLVFPTLAGMAVTAPELVPLLLGENWSAAILPLQLAAIAVPVRMIAAILSTSTTAMGRTDVDFRNTLTGVFVMPVCFLLGAQWGAVGLAAAWLIGAPIVFVLNFPRTSGVIGVTASDLLRVLASPFIATILMSMVVLFVGNLLTDYIHGLSLLFAMITAGIFVYSFSLLGIDKGARVLAWKLVKRNNRE